MKVPFFIQRAVPETAHERAHYYARSLRPEPAGKHPGNWLDALVAAVIVTVAIYCIVNS